MSRNNALGRKERRAILAEYRKRAQVLRALDVNKFCEFMQRTEGRSPTSERGAIGAMQAAKIGINKWCKSPAHGNCAPIFTEDEIESAKVWLEAEGMHSVLAMVEA